MSDYEIKSLNARMSLILTALEAVSRDRARDRLEFGDARARAEELEKRFQVLLNDFSNLEAEFATILVKQDNEARRRMAAIPTMKDEIIKEILAKLRNDS